MLARSTDAAVAEQIRRWARELGFQQVGIADVALDRDAAHLRGLARSRPARRNGVHGAPWQQACAAAELVPGTLRVISVRMDYGRNDTAAWATLADGEARLRGATRWAATTTS
jgi:epoxyqueuosine reductase